MSYQEYKTRIKRMNDVHNSSDRKDVISNYKKVFKTNQFKDYHIENSFINFLKNFNVYYKTHKNVSNINKFVIGKNEDICKRKNPLIFQIKSPEEEVRIKFDIIIPFKNFFLASPLHIYHKEEFYGTEGFLVTETSKDVDPQREYLEVFYFWSRLIDDGWAFSSFFTKKRSLGGPWEDHKNDYGNENDALDLELRKEFMYAFSKTMANLLSLIEKKEYTTYKKYYPSGIVEKEIVFASDVKAHKRHFWNDTGYFNIPNLSKEELLNKGYGIDELVFKDGELRKDVPYKIINSFIVGEEKKRKEDNKIINLYKKRILRQEEKLLKVLLELFPNDFIKRHDRKILKGLELDFIIRGKRIAFEYDGEQHFDKKLCEEVFKSDFKELQKRDRKKDKLCLKKNINLIRIKYDEPLTKTHVKKKLKERGLM